jgi:metal-dependent amidase/aminoacylase/carboxypeptidase family protein
MPESSIDPVVMAAATVMRLQTIVSREVAPTDSAVVTRVAAGRHEREHYSGRGIDQIECAHI